MLNGNVYRKHRMERSSDTALLAVEDMSMISVGTVCGKLIGVEIVAHRDFSDLGVRRRLGPFRKGSIGIRCLNTTLKRQKCMYVIRIRKLNVVLVLLYFRHLSGFL